MIKLIDMEKDNSFFVITESEREELKKLLAKKQKSVNELNENIPKKYKDMAIKVFIDKAAE